MNKPYEVGQMVTIDDDNFMKSASGMILDVSSSSDPSDTMYTVEVEKHGTHFFYGYHLIPVKEVEHNVHGHTA